LLEALKEPAKHLRAQGAIGFEANKGSKRRWAFSGSFK